MKRSITLAAAALFASSVFAGSALAQGQGSGNAGGNGGGHGGGQGSGQVEAPGASGFAPGQMKSEGESARDYAPGLSDNPAPGQEMLRLRSDAEDEDEDDLVENDDEIDEETTASVDGNYGKLISLLRSGKGGDMTGLSSDTQVTVIAVGDVVPNDNRAALDNALSAQSGSISELRTELEEAEIDALADIDLQTVVAAQVAADGSLTVYVDEGDDS